MLFCRGFIINNRHESVLEHEKITIVIVCDRGVSHEIVRHRIASYSQESTRYCDYREDKHGSGISVINPKMHFKNPESFDVWFECMQKCEEAYFQLLAYGEKPQMARSVLPNSLKTEIVITYNLREWGHFFKLRTSRKAHPQMREITIPLLKKMQEKIPIIFDDIEFN